ncbi:MAG: hypothetical protein K2N72_10065 [Oscillospiraceae bacterium]|nr:hypothetical protein [Oscillospiraceae bacterium]
MEKLLKKRSNAVGLFPLMRRGEAFSSQMPRNGFVPYHAINRLFSPTTP